MSESLNDKTLSMLLQIKKLDDALLGVNDYGEATGFLAESDQITNDAFSQVGMLRARAANLIQRLERHRRLPAP